MPGWLKGLLTIVIWAGAPVGVLAAVLSATGNLHGHTWLIVVAVVFGLLYGLEAGILTIYDLSTPAGWGELIVDLTWSLPNTVWGCALGNLIFWPFGSPNRAQSENKSWIVFKPYGGGGFGTNVLQTHGTVNLGGAGQHERMHLLQARIFGPLFLPIYLLSYVITSLTQLLWTITLGWILKLAGARNNIPLQPPATSVVHGFFGWIYYATPFEFWAYSSGNP